MISGQHSQQSSDRKKYTVYISNFLGNLQVYFLRGTMVQSLGCVIICSEKQATATAEKPTVQFNYFHYL